jgi:O-antigen/teichoic acid export membrane protein
MAGSALTGAGMQRLRTTSQLTAAIVNFLLNLWLIPEYGWHGAAWSSLATDGALSAMNWGMLVIITKRAEVNTGRSMAGK